MFLDVQLADHDEQAEIGDLLEKSAQRVCRKDALRQIQMRLQAYAVERDAGALQPFEKLEEKMASIAFDLQIILEAEFIDHQFRPRRQVARLPQRPRNVVGAEGLQERTVSQAVRPMAGLYRFIDDIPLRNGLAIAREHGLEVPLHERPSIFLDQRGCSPRRYALVPHQRVSMELLLVREREVRQDVHRAEIERARRLFDGTPFQRHLGRQPVALAQYRGPQVGFRHDLPASNRRAEVALVPGEPRRQRVPRLRGWARHQAPPRKSPRRSPKKGRAAVSFWKTPAPLVIVDGQSYSYQPRRYL